MDHQQIAQLLFHGTPSSEAFSALPDAPVVIPADRVPTLGRTRVAIAGTLHRFADILTPARTCTTSHTAA